MDQAIKDAWIENLRSKKYSQGQGALHRVGYEGGTDLFCCLGVLCETLIEQGVDVAQGRTLRDTIYYDTEWCAGYLSPRLTQVVDIKEDMQQTLAGMNDSGKSFNQIADWINRNL